MNRGHKWRCLGGAYGWELWECSQCHKEKFPSIFGTLWTLFRCTAQEVSEAG